MKIQFFENIAPAVSTTKQFKTIDHVVVKETPPQVKLSEKHRLIVSKSQSD